MPQLIGALAIIALIIAIIVYVIIPLFLFMSVLGAIFGSCVGIYNYMESFYANVRPESDPKGRIAAVCLALVGLAVLAAIVTLLNLKYSG